MNPTLASLICSAGIAGLFYLNRDDAIETSKALWVPVAWMWIIGSRPVSIWLGITPAANTNVQLDGSPLDAVVYGGFLVAALVVLLVRGRQSRILLGANGPVLLYFCYCLVSVLWSGYPDVAFKRWIKDFSDLAMVLVILTEREPVAALRRLFSRTGFILFPVSVLLIRYYDYLGRAYTPDGDQMNTGVTTNKNILGLMVFVLSLGALWTFLNLLADKGAPHRSRRLVAQGVFLAFGVMLLGMAHSATSIACFILGGALIVVTSLPAFARLPSRIHAIFLAIILAGGLTMLGGGEGDVVHALGRKADLTGRADIWKAVLAAAGNPVFGVGFESFWNTRSALVSQNLQGWWQAGQLNSAHNGYIEVYLNLGYLGLGFLALVFVSGYRRATAAFRRNPEFASLILAYIATAAIYSITEAGFRILTLSWIFLLLAVIGGNGMAGGAIGDGAEKSMSQRAGNESNAPHSRALSPVGREI